MKNNFERMVILFIFGSLASFSWGSTAVEDLKMKKLIQKYYGIQNDLVEPSRALTPFQEVKKFLSYIPTFGNEGILDSIYEMDTLGLSQSEAGYRAWSYHAFNTHLGGMAFRYGDPRFVNAGSWKEKYRLYRKDDSEELINDGKIDFLSPIEKYEYLIGSENFRLTKNEWSMGKDVLDSLGKIPKWFGACHGTAPASITSPRPKRAISLRSYDGKNLIRFYPADIKTLISMAWAKKPDYATIIGKRCYDKNTSGKSVLELSDKCFDPNPGSFHLSLVNSIGKFKRPVLIDSYRGHEVWNKPVHAYRYKYFSVRNPSSVSSNLADSIIHKDAYLNDPYKYIRKSNYHFLVGIQMDISYVHKTTPIQTLTDGMAMDKIRSRRILYDLELDNQGNIVGGVWRGEKSPDFIWSVSEKTTPYSLEDKFIGPEIYSYTGNSVLPPFLRNHALKAAGTNTLSFKLLEQLNRLAQ